MRLFGRWHKGHRRCKSGAYSPRVIRVAGIPVAYGRLPMAPRGAAMHQRGQQMISEVKSSERFWRTPGNRVRRIKPHIYTWGKTKLPKQRIAIKAGKAPNRRVAYGFVPGLPKLFDANVVIKPHDGTRLGPMIRYNPHQGAHRIYIKGKPRLTKTPAVD